MIRPHREQPIFKTHMHIDSRIEIENLAGESIIPFSFSLDMESWRNEMNYEIGRNNPSPMDDKKVQHYSKEGITHLQPQSLHGWTPSHTKGGHNPPRTRSVEGQSWRRRGRPCWEGRGCGREQGKRSASGLVQALWSRMSCLFSNYMINRLDHPPQIRIKYYLSKAEMSWGCLIIW